MDTSEHFKVLKLLGEGSYGKVMLAVHRKRGEGGTNTSLSQRRHTQEQRSWRHCLSLVSARYSHGSEVLPSWVHLSFLLPEGVQPLPVVLHPPVPDQSSGNRLLHTFTLRLRSAGGPLRWSLRRHHAWGTQSLRQQVVQHVMDLSRLKVFQFAGSLSFKHFCDRSITHTPLLPSSSRWVWRRTAVSGWCPSSVALCHTCTLLVLSTETSNRRTSSCATQPAVGSN